MRTLTEYVKTTTNFWYFIQKIIRVKPPLLGTSVYARIAQLRFPTARLVAPLRSIGANLLGRQQESSNRC